MKLFEVVDLGAIRSILAVKQGEADNKNLSSTIPFVSIKDELRSFGIATIDAFNQLKDKIDPQGDVIAKVIPGTKDDEGTIVLATQEKNKAQQQPIKQNTGPGIQQMASRNSKKLKPSF